MCGTEADVGWAVVVTAVPWMVVMVIFCFGGTAGSVLHVRVVRRWLRLRRRRSHNRLRRRGERD